MTSNEIIKSSKQTKKWRNTQSWYVNGKKNECEKYQKQQIIDITGITELKSTGMRLNTETYELTKRTNPLSYDDGLNWSEDFDAETSVNDKKIFINLKFVCDKGGAQTRTIREVYHFVKCQLEYLLKHKINNTYFVNILDGDTSHSCLKYFKYLLSLDKYKDISNYVFVNDMYNFKIFYDTNKNIFIK